MKKILMFMMRNKTWFLIAIVASAVAFFAFNTTSPNPPITQKQKLLASVGYLLQQEHYSPKAINDNLSKLIFTEYLKDLDDDKTLFVAADFNALKKYETAIDEEIKGINEIAFVPAVNALYNKRTDEVIKLYKQVLSQPFDFTKNEMHELDGEKLKIAANENERNDRLRKRLKYLTLERLVSLQEQREKSKIDSVINKTDAKLEAEARAGVLKGYDRIYDRIKAKYNDDERFNTFINVITKIMDPHTTYFPPVEKRAFDEQMSGQFYGIGAQLREEDGTIKIAAVMPGSPALKSGQIAVNDVILKVGQGGSEEMVDIAGYIIEDAVKLIRGGKGTEVKLLVKKIDGTSKLVVIQRDKIVQDETYAKSTIVKEGDKKIGVIYLDDFYINFENPKEPRCSDDVAKEIVKLQDEGIDGLIMDLRNNGGGSLQEVIKMVGFFIKTGPVVQVKDKDGNVNVYEDRNPDVLYNGPLTVMVNEFSASASEIFAAAIQDYKRGIVVGSSSTYGKGTVQRNVPIGKPLDFFSGLTEFGAVKLTFQKFYRVNGGSTQLKGVVPDIILPDMLEYYKIREKDTKTALPWDEVKQANIQAFNGYETFVPTAKEMVANNPSFKLIKENSQWLYKLREAPVSLNINQYKEFQKQIKSTTTQTTALLQLTNKMDMSVPKLDSAKYFNNVDKPKGERYKAWLESQKKDFYIDEVAKIVVKMIELNATALAQLN
jgi:carboxyl-terminal processing protease